MIVQAILFVLGFVIGTAIAGVSLKLLKMILGEKSPFVILFVFAEWVVIIIAIYRSLGVL